MAFMDSSLQQVNLRLILLLNMRTDREDWQKKTLYSILPGTIQSQSSFAEGKGYYLDVSWIEYGDAAGGWQEEQRQTDVSFSAEPDFSQAMEKARNLILEAGRSHEPRPALIVVHAGEKAETDSLPEEMDAKDCICAVISMQADADAASMNAWTPDSALSIESQNVEEKGPRMFWTVHSEDQLMAAISNMIPGCLSGSRTLFEAQKALADTSAAEKDAVRQEAPSMDALKTERQGAEAQETQTESKHTADETAEDTGSGTAQGAETDPEAAAAGQNGGENRPEGSATGNASAEQSVPVQPVSGKQNYAVPQMVSLKEQDEHFAERAQQREEYCTYESHAYVLKNAEHFQIFEARRIGLGHLGKKMPCQDACLYAEHAHGFVIVAADGVSACPRSDLGAKIACESAAGLAAEYGRMEPDEEKFVQAVCSDAFFRKVRAEWLRRITEDWKQNPTEGNVSISRLYGTTLMFAAATEHWWVCRNIGDGQILLFNSQDFQRIRLTEKDSPAPRGLMYDTYLEHVQTGVFPREQFPGVLLTTDGMADQMAKIGPDSWHIWALQLQERFAKHQEPYLPFVYEGIIAGEKRRPDLSRQRNASDDCTVVLAFAQEQSVPAWMQAVRRSILAHAGEGAEIELHRTLGRRVSYNVYTKTERMFVCALPENEACAVRSPRLGFEQVILLPQTRDDVWSEAGYRFYAYHLDGDASLCTLEEAMQAFEYCSHSQTVRGESLKAGEKVLKVDTEVNRAVEVLHEQLSVLQERVDEAGLFLDWTAPCWIFTDIRRGRLMVPQAAVCETAPCAPVPWHLTMKQLSPALIGFVCADHQPWPYPFFSPGDAPEGTCYYLTGKGMCDLPEAQRRFFTVVRHPQNGMLGLRNAGQSAWKVVDLDGTEADCPPQGVAMLKNGRQIIVQISGSGRQTYTIQLTENKGGDRA